ncbi:ABC transporter permease [Nocardioides sp. SYSU DS0651]|uniref:ABC transporter permease n=1 Tax=Nocardioides sp. SYSU DS0651 TaxID=3415955 RepID=UPI003F4B4BEC
MWAYALRRCAVGLLLLFAVTIITFVLFFAAPVDQARLACGKQCSESQIAQTQKALGYDKPLHVQWSSFMKGLVVGRDFPADPELRAAAPEIVTHCAAPCLGYSHHNAKTVNEEIADAIPITASISIMALVLWLIGGVSFGILAAITKGSFLDRSIVGATLVAYAFPSFFVAVFLLTFVVIKWEILPYPEYTSIAEGGVGAWLGNLFLPGFSLALLFLASYVRMTRAFVLESMSEDYIRTAKAKGLKGRKVLTKHGLRAALTPLVTMTGLDFATLLGGSIITETVFDYAGLGLITVQASAAWDLPIIVGVVLVAAAFVILLNIIVDIAYAFIDPRVRLG